jgi:hypothetical protein
MNHNLRVCRVSSLGYDMYLLGSKPDVMPANDIEDPSGLGRSLEQRFVEVVMGYKQPYAADGSPVEYLPELESMTWASADKERPEKFARSDWDASYFLTDERNRTSIWQKTIDRQFPNCNQFTLDQLHCFADKACEGMQALNRTWNEEALEEELEVSSEDVLLVPGPTLGHINPGGHAGEADR